MSAPEVVAVFDVPDGLVYRLTLDAGCYCLHVTGVATFTWSADGADGAGRVETRLHRGATPELARVLATGLVTAARATVEGYAVLHASAVEVDGRAVAVVGPVGTGKSTVAAMLCAAGARVVTDDVLVLDQVDGQVACRRASSQIRLRPAAAGLTDLFETAPAVTGTADDRVGVSPPATAYERCPLQAVLLPRPSPDAVVVALARVPPAAAVFSLLAEPRVQGLGTVHQQRLFEAAADLVGQVPVYEAVIPWGPPWSLQVAADLLAAATSAIAPRS